GPVLRRLVIGVLGLGALGLFVFAMLWWRVCAGDACPSVEMLEKYTPRQTSKVYAADGRLVGELGLERRTLIRVSELPATVKNAFVLTEDKRFYQHHGIDYSRIFGALLRNVRALGFSQGFSTITMQLARNVFPEHISRDRALGLRPLIRKLREAKVALAIERKFTKDQILELYLNQIPFGYRAFGIETAAQRYFGKSARQLNAAEAALLAALPKAPERYNPQRFPERAVQRRNVILELMHNGGALTDGETSLAKAWPLQLARRTAANGSQEVAPYFVEWVRQLMQQKFGPGLYNQGYEIHTTLDLDLQISAERALAAQLQAIESGQFGKWEHPTFEQYISKGADSADKGPNSPYMQGAFIALDPRTGAVRALVGGRDFDDSKFNRATQAVRQPGSTFKPIVYSTAIRAGRPPTYILDDAPLTMLQLDGTEWAPQNYDLKFLGPMPLRRALYESRNLPAIRLGMEIGEESVVEMAHRFGITSDILPVPSINIGAADVVPLEMVNAYSVFANMGWRSQANPILRVTDATGKVLWEPQPVRETVLSPEEAWLMTDMLRDVIRRGTAVNAVWNKGFQLPAGGKTGTTNDGSDVWFIGFTADLVAGVWMGFDKRQKIMDNAQGGRLAAPAWTAFMLDAYRRKPAPPEWPRPSALVSLEVEETTGQRHGLCPGRGVTEWFIRGTEPSDMCVPGINRARRH
ncbi:MAG TPA: PBP1A family penicillin-binding protein, partial [Gemmatimonadaceae bacterium]|nr:PBP1A family penicillin-binding protein [Gemmatimonadaceae bacterium]